MATPPDFTTGSVLTAAQMNAVGLWRITGCTVTSVGGTAATASNGVITVGSGNTSVTVSSAFSADFENYKIIITGGTASAGDNLSMQLSGSTGSTYNTGGSFTTYGSATLSGYGPAATTTWLIGYVATTHTAIVTDVFSPQLATPSRMVTASTSVFNYSFTGANSSTVQSTGFTLSITTGTMSSQTIRVYGYRN